MLNIKDYTLKNPLIQGGMGVGISMGRLAGSVAACDAMGVISTVNAGYREADFEKNPVEANIRALQKEIQKALTIAKGRGMVAVNAMVEVTHYEETVRAAIKAGAAAVISGAGLPLRLPEFTKGTKTAAAPIVSSPKAATLIMKTWDRHYEVTPDFIVIEGKKAGGHLGFSREELLQDTAASLKEILTGVKKAVLPFEKKYKRKIPIFTAGGVFVGQDMAEMIKAGADGVQIGTRFIATEECDASEAFKEVILSAREEDVRIIESPVGMPARAIDTGLLKKTEKSYHLFAKKCNDCLKHCKKGTETCYCISRALIEAVKGNTEDGLFFCGANVGRVQTILPVKTWIDEIIGEWRKTEI